MNPPVFIMLIPLVLGMVGFILVRKHLLGTTLIAPWCWSLLAFLLVCTIEPAYHFFHRPCPPAMLYIARISLLLPVISLLGAKRPQDGPWNFVVLALWGVLASPAAVAYGLNASKLNIPAAWLLVMGVLCVLTFVNTIDSNWLASICVCLAQLLLVFNYEYTKPLRFWYLDTFFACYLLAAAAIVHAVSDRSRRKHKHPLDRLWLDYRRDFGLFWSLRVQERLNDAATKFEWPIHLTWSGWMHTNGKPLGKEFDPQTQRAILQTFRGLLRRFVSQEWINERLAD